MISQFITESDFYFILSINCMHFFRLGGRVVEPEWTRVSQGHTCNLLLTPAPLEEYHPGFSYKNQGDIPPESTVQKEYEITLVPDLILAKEYPTVITQNKAVIQ